MCSAQYKVRYCVYVQNIVCVLHGYLRKRPGSNPRFSLSKLSTLLLLHLRAARGVLTARRFLFRQPVRLVSVQLVSP